MPIITHPDRASWLAARRDGLGASDIGAVLGVSPYRSPRQVWLEKSGLPHDEVVETDRMRWGQELEPLARQWLEDSVQRATQRVPALTAHTHSVHSWMRATPDDLLDVDEHPELPAGRYVVDYKIASPWDRGYQDGQAPAGYTLQILWQMLVTGREHGLLVVLPLADRLRFDDVKRYTPAERDTCWSHVRALLDLVLEHDGADIDAKLALLGIATPHLRVFHRTGPKMDALVSEMVHEAQVFWRRVEATRAALRASGGEIDWAALAEFEPPAVAADYPELRKRYARWLPGETWDAPDELAEEFVEALRASKMASERYDHAKARMLQEAGATKRITHKDRTIATLRGSDGSVSLYPNAALTKTT